RSCFFFQAEDGIRDRNVTGVQTCALPISNQIAPLSVFPNFVPSAFVTRGKVSANAWSSCPSRRINSNPEVILPHWSLPPTWRRRSEERRVGKEGKGGRWTTERTSK